MIYGLPLADLSDPEPRIIVVDLLISEESSKYYSKLIDSQGRGDKI